MICPICGKEFEKRYPREVYCSFECRKTQERRYNASYNDLRKKPDKPPPKHTLSDTLKELKNESYAERQKRETIEKYARILIDDVKDNSDSVRVDNRGEDGSDSVLG